MQYHIHVPRTTYKDKKILHVQQNKLPLSIVRYLTADIAVLVDPKSQKKSLLVFNPLQASVRLALGKSPWTNSANSQARDRLLTRDEGKYSFEDEVGWTIVQLSACGDRPDPRSHWQTFFLFVAAITGQNMALLECVWDQAMLLYDDENAPKYIQEKMMGILNIGLFNNPLHYMYAWRFHNSGHARIGHQEVQDPERVTEVTDDVSAKFHYPKIGKSRYATMTEEEKKNSPQKDIAYDYMMRQAEKMCSKQENKSGKDEEEKEKEKKKKNKDNKKKKKKKNTHTHGYKTLALEELANKSLTEYENRANDYPDIYNFYGVPSSRIRKIKEEQRMPTITCKPFSTPTAEVIQEKMCTEILHENKGVSPTKKPVKGNKSVDLFYKQRVQHQLQAPEGAAEKQWENPKSPL